MFRAPAKPSANAQLAQKWDMIEYETHRYNVRHMKSRIDQKAPLTFMHHYIKPKNLQMELERESTIKRHNGYLMARLARIKRKGGWTDNKNYHALKSLNTTSRQQEMMNLTYSNKIMLERIRESHTCYNRSKLEDEYELQKKQRTLIERYPTNWREIRDQIQESRAEIRRKYVYPMVGFYGKDGKHLTKGKVKQIGDVKEEAGKLPTPSEKSQYRNPAKSKKSVITEKGESKVSKKRQTDIGAKKPNSVKDDTGMKSSKPPPPEKLHQGTESKAARKPAGKPVPDRKMNINAGHGEKNPESKVDEASEKIDNEKNVTPDADGKENQEGSEEDPDSDESREEME